MKALQTSNPFDLEIIHRFVADPAAEAETQLHAKFEQHRTSGEWFELTPAQVADLKQIAKYENGTFIEKKKKGS